MKRKLFQAICRLLKVPEGTLAPEWLTWLFFPLLKYALNFAGVRFDFSSQVYTIQGVKMSESFIRELGERGIPEGGYFKLLRREKGGAIRIERVNPPQDQLMNEFLTAVLENGYTVTIKPEPKLNGFMLEFSFGERRVRRLIRKHDILYCKVDLLSMYMQDVNRAFADSMPNQDPRIGGIFLNGTSST